MTRRNVIAVSGVKNSGKTTLLERLLPALREIGLTAAVIKHDGHAFAADRPGTDTFRLLQAGAVGAAVFDGEKFQAVKRAVASETELMALYPDADIIFLEGFKGSDYPKIEVVRRGNSSESVCRPETLLALVTDTALNIPNVPAFAPDDTDGLRRLIAAYLTEETP